jgi:acetyl-CoA C-acetyltransferase
MPTQQAHYDRSVFIVDGSRTPFLKAGQKPGPFAASDLAVMTGKTLLERQPFAPTELNEVILGCVMAREDEANIARVVSLRLGCGKAVPAWTVQRNCGSGMQSLDSGFKDIACGRHDLVLAGGTEAMSHAPLIASPQLTNWLADLRSSKNLMAKLKVMTQFRPSFLKPIIALIHGLTDPTVGMIMGQTAENLAYLFNITREQMDEYSLRSHQRAIAAEEKGYLNEITPLYANNGTVYEVDTGVRRDTSLEKLAKLKPIFDKFGRVTAGNSAQVTDGAALLILASEDAIQRYHLPVLGRIIDVNWAGVEPETMGLGPVFATTPLLQRHNLRIEDIDYWEINEAFAAQMLACLAAWENPEFCRNRLGLEGAFGKIDNERLNVDGGGIALGHPVGASGARIVLHLLEVLKRNNAKKGIATMCIGGGQGGAMLVERVL